MNVLGFGKNISIRHTFVGIGLSVSLGFLSLVYVGWQKGAEAVSAVRSSEVIHWEMNLFSEMRLANARLSLIAMDALLERKEGGPSAALREAMEQQYNRIVSSEAEMRRFADEFGRPAPKGYFERDAAAILHAATYGIDSLVADGAAEASFEQVHTLIHDTSQRIDAELIGLEQLGKKTIKEFAAKAEAAAINSKITQSLSALAFLAVIGTMILVVTNRIAQRLERFGADMNAVAGGDLDWVIEEEGRSDEIGKMAKALVNFREAAREKLRFEADFAAESDQIKAIEAQQAEELARMNAVQKETLGFLAQALDGLAEGDLDYRIDNRVPPEFAAIAHSFNKAADSLLEILAELSNSAEGLQPVASGLKESTGELSSHADRQALALERGSDVLRGIGGSVRSTREVVGKAVISIRETEAEVRSSNTVVDKAVAAMGAIDESSKKIANIISVIDDIAFQTNLLALNAGVEAARAGEAGKGFAVVAQEVRQLSQRCAEAADEIKDLITVSSRQVKSGVELVEKTGAALHGILCRVDDVQTMIEGLSSANSKQLDHHAEMESFVAELGEASRSGLRLVEARTQMIEQITGEADLISGIVSSIKTRGQDRPQIKRFNPGDHGAGAGKSAASGASDAGEPVAARPVQARVAVGGGASAAVAVADDWDEF